MMNVNMDSRNSHSFRHRQAPDSCVDGWPVGFVPVVAVAALPSPGNDAVLCGPVLEFVSWASVDMDNVAGMFTMPLQIYPARPSVSEATSASLLVPTMSSVAFGARLMRVPETVIASPPGTSVCEPMM